jgi:hypothetical protein
MILGLLYLSFLGYLVFSAAQLPDKVATHFDIDGRPDSWMSRSSHLWFTGLMGSVMPLFFVAFSFVGRFFPGGLNIPHRDYWLAPKRRRETFDYLLRQSFWLACMALVFFIGIHFLIIEANRHAHPRISIPWIVALGGVCVAGSGIWFVSLLLHFTSPPPSPSEER